MIIKNIFIIMIKNIFIIMIIGYSIIIFSSRQGLLLAFEFIVLFYEE